METTLIPIITTSINYTATTKRTTKALVIVSLVGNVGLSSRFWSLTTTMGRRRLGREGGRGGGGGGGGGPLWW